METGAGVALVEQDVATRGVQFARTTGDAGDFLGIRPLNSGTCASRASILML